MKKYRHKNNYHPRNHHQYHRKRYVQAADSQEDTENISTSLPNNYYNFFSEFSLYNQVNSDNTQQNAKKNTLFSV